MLPEMFIFNPPKSIPRQVTKHFLTPVPAKYFCFAVWEINEHHRVTGPRNLLCNRSEIIFTGVALVTHYTLKLEDIGRGARPWHMNFSKRLAYTFLLSPLRYFLTHPQKPGSWGFCSNFVSNWSNLFGKITECRKYSEDSLRKIFRA